MAKQRNPLPMNWIESTPEWKACFETISAEEYLALYGDLGGSVKLMAHASRGVPRPSMRKRSRKGVIKASD